MSLPTKHKGRDAVSLALLSPGGSDLCAIYDSCCYYERNSLIVAYRRFILNIPAEQRQDTVRIVFQMEQAHWFYLDFWQEKEPTLPKYQLKTFVAKMFAHVPFLKHLASESEKIYDTWREYKISIPVCGAILLNRSCDKVLMVKSWGSKGSWTFPKGKINKDESDLNCAIREVCEETSYDFSELAEEQDKLEATRHQTARLFIVVGVPEDFLFQPKTRKEISDIQWHPLDTLPSTKQEGKETRKYYFVWPFIKPLRNWLSSSRGVEVFQRRNSITPKKKKGKRKKKKPQDDMTNNSSNNNNQNINDNNNENMVPGTFTIAMRDGGAGIVVREDDVEAVLKEIEEPGQVQQRPLTIASLQTCGAMATFQLDIPAVLAAMR